jgi:outer membrane protein assembly factor BamA
MRLPCLGFGLIVTLFGRAASAEPPPRGGYEAGDTEFTVLPFVGGNSDVGLGGGYIMSLSESRASYEPFVYRLESAGTITFQREGGGLRVPYIDDYLLIVLPHVIKNRLRVEARLSYTRETTLKYYGLGNASTVGDERSATDAYFEHERVHPSLLAHAEYRGGPLRVSWGLSFTHNELEIPEGTRLAEDLENGPERVRRALTGTGPHTSVAYSFGLGWDTRDNETTPERGSYHTTRVDLSPGAFGNDTGRWGRYDTAFRFYVPVVRRRLVLAARVVGDVLFGAPPFYELPRFDQTNAVGGVKGVRGVPAQRYYGKLKAFGNLELRSELFGFDAFGERRRIGVVAFADAGRVWADYRADPELDGSGLGLKYGLGGGLRVTSGTSFVLRLDVAWSPDAEPVSGYLISGHQF